MHLAARLNWLVVQQRIGSFLNLVCLSRAMIQKVGADKVEKDGSGHNLCVSKCISKILRLHADGCRMRVSFIGDHVRYPKLDI